MPDERFNVPISLNEWERVEVERIVKILNPTTLPLSEQNVALIMTPEVRDVVRLVLICGLGCINRGQVDYKVDLPADTINPDDAED